MFGRLLENFLRKGTDWLFRVHSFEGILLRCAFGLLATVYAGPRIFEVVLRLAVDSYSDGDSGFQKVIDSVYAAEGYIFALCTIAILISLTIYGVRGFAKLRNQSKKRTIVIEARGLRDDDGTSLEQIIRNEVDGQVVPVLLDLRNNLDGCVIAPERALDSISTLHRSLAQHKNAIDRNDLTVVYGGLTSVPYTFLTGVLLDDEGEVQTFDWDRVLGSWRDLHDADDQKSFIEFGIDTVAGAKEVTMAISFSYPVNDSDLITAFPFPIVRLTLDGMSSDAHWSFQKQSRLAQQFLEFTKQLSALGVERIHLVLAAPNSVVFTFGRRYDKRNLPKLIVYQYQGGQTPAYPWGVLMPVSGIDLAEVVYSEKRSS